MDVELWVVSKWKVAHANPFRGSISCVPPKASQSYGTIVIELWIVKYAIFVYVIT